MVDISRIPARLISSVRGMGVADMVSMSTWARRAVMCSLCSTPKRCSSSTMTSPRSLYRTVGCSRRWVPMTMSTLPSARPLIVSLDSASLVKRDSPLIVTGNADIRSVNVERCCWASNVVGTRMATCLPSWTALNAARTAISVLP